ncbi:probable indole-3-pyruvate monooxygenase YUCCA4 [Impatiens glandulifera]|uniref:probable indole-3-pyruvate monooxygenase YUCCA4 n=1 Tax=Impatiens glandulifera TaxID=253017 RepID=UPI001FB07ABA|nr:probable indole-3-pyruvate monooxygenase YUCCA4 [Impatiens glandulifera]
MKSQSTACFWIPGPLIVGAGPSGLAVAACLKQKGVPFLILEKETCLASLWKLRTYDRLKLHLPKKFCQLPFFPFPPEFSEYPSKQQFICYLDAYAKHFCINPLYGKYVHCAKYDTSMGLWTVQTDDTKYVSRWLIVATGENEEPLLPEIAGREEFKGKMQHSSEYHNGVDLKGNKVLVVGCGNSGMEVSLDLCNCGAQVSLVVRNKMHILPRQVLGISTFGMSIFLLRWFPVKLVDKILLLCSRMILGETHRFGIQRPEIGPLELKNTTGKTPALDVGAISKIRSGDIQVVGGIRRFTAAGVEFTDGTVSEYDVVILATGYRSNVSTWLEEDGNYFNKENGYPNNPFPINWKGSNGIYSVGFTRRGLLGVSHDALEVAEDIAKQWNMRATTPPAYSLLFKV